MSARRELIVNGTHNLVWKYHLTMLTPKTHRRPLRHEIYLTWLCIQYLFLVLEFEKVYLGNIPSAESYEKSFMHRDVISHIVATE